VREGDALAHVFFHPRADPRRGQPDAARCATAFPHRGAHCSLLILAVWTDPAKDEEHIRWARESWEAMRPFAGGRVYVNYLGDEGDERVREAYDPNYDRLVALKTKYDPTNFWRRNQNIRPPVQS